MIADEKDVLCLNGMKKNLPGLALCFVIACFGWLLGTRVPVIGAPVFAIMMGMLLALLIRDRSKLNAGIAFASKKILQFAVILLGFGMNLFAVAQTGLQSLPIILATITTSLLVSYALYRLLNIPSKTAVLVGIGSSICGGSAIAATAPIIHADDDEIAQSISVIFLFNVIAAIIFPTLGSILGMSNEGFGLFAGTAINDTSSVTAAATAWDMIHASNTLEIAAIVKMTRTLAIIPIALVLAFHQTKRETRKVGTKVRLRRIFPYFVLFFVLASVITTVCTSMGVPGSAFLPLKTLSKFFIVTAMAAIGLNTNLVNLIKNGGKAIFVGFCCWISISCISLTMQYMLGLW